MNKVYEILFNSKNRKTFKKNKKLSHIAYCEFCESYLIEPFKISKFNNDLLKDGFFIHEQESFKISVYVRNLDTIYKMNN